MAITSPDSELDICNMALNRVGEKVITAAELLAAADLDPESEPRAMYCNIHYAQTRDALLRSHWWRFAKARAALVAAAAPTFEWSNAFTLPADFLREKSVYEDNATIHKNTVYSYELEDLTLLTDESECNLRYIKQVTLVTSFDPLFLEVFVLQLAIKLAYPCAGVGTAGRALVAEIKDELYRPKGLMSRVRALDRQEGERIGRSDRILWNSSRSANMGRIDSQLGGP